MRISSKSLADKWSECVQNHHCSWRSKKSWNGQCPSHAWVPHRATCPICIHACDHIRNKGHVHNLQAPTCGWVKIYFGTRKPLIRCMTDDHMISEFCHRTWWCPLLCKGFPYGWYLWYDAWHMVLIYLIWDWHDFCKPPAFCRCETKAVIWWMWICPRPPCSSIISCNVGIAMS